MKSCYFSRETDFYSHVPIQGNIRTVNSKNLEDKQVHENFEYG